MTADASVISGPSVVKLARGVRLHDDPVRGRKVLLAPERAMALDDIAVLIVQALDGKRSLDRIAADFAAEFDAPVVQITNDVSAFAKELAVRRMLEIVE
ncbi:pyrroloquinoline quinone biosynthesis peptide chaperone PqqD [Sinorhizobium numidicum]|uniref:Pyrroloquinoline quinone biosynthesis peptide chaperone PqqD n=1 Tax=Sinorhizobium numidicum TaxID=680248 RepID=A0ABY8CMZ0_9HYPH|nr:pyrroloquinoline quinone biosynthesis peptide chaperone PqqD [Sinorhizobium numidicum]WEX74045.1 pyrroloquinoline quinone biosynthesis peptide chaperone PqqD [Sinorhizobium numidicum]WEX80030.1 pyrroloquinoline quinone biosynthesis peptide chaperone PqqD [Sinorhizobium numidicum]